jgi:hypothetical protein
MGCSNALSTLILVLLCLQSNAQQKSSRKVATAEALAQAIADSVQHVVITEHLDLTNLASLPYFGKVANAGYAFNKPVLINLATASVRVRPVSSLASQLVHSFMALQNCSGSRLVRKNFNFRIGASVAVQGECTAAPPTGLDPEPSSPTMCHLLVKEDFMQLPSNTTANVWLDNLYLQVHKPLFRPGFAEQRLQAVQTTSLEPLCV